MADRTLVLAIFGNEAAADNAAAALKDTGLTSTDAIGVLAVDATGKLKEEKVGARSSGKGAVGVLTPFGESSMISSQLSELGGASEEHTVSDEALKAGQ